METAEHSRGVTVSPDLFSSYYVCTRQYCLFPIVKYAAWLPSYLYSLSYLAKSEEMADGSHVYKEGFSPRKAARLLEEHASNGLVT